MLIANRVAITRTFRHVPQAAEAWLRTWLRKAQAASWYSDADVLQDYPAAFCDGSGVARFPFIPGAQALEVYVDYRSSVVGVNGLYDAARQRM